MPKAEFRDQAADAGFSTKQIDFLEGYVAKLGHTHEADDITDFETAVEEIAGDDLDGDDEEE